MRPLFLKIENFKSYGESQNQIDFNNIKVACIVGKNGNGKSSIAEAIAWALFGEFERLQTGKRGKISETEYINAHKDYMQVEFEFEIDGVIYRVVRRLDRRGKKYLSLFMKKNDVLIPITEANYTQTQNRLEKILGIDFNVFLHSAYLSQKRTEDFLLSSPEDRREILAKILNLSIYDQINELAKEKRKEKKVLLDIKIKENEENIKIASEEENIKRAIIGLEEKSKKIANELDTLKNELNNLVDQKYQTEQKLKDIRRKREEKDEYVKKLNEIKKRIENTQSDLLKIEDDLKNEPEITSKAKEYEQLKSTLECLQKDYETYISLKNNIALVEKEKNSKEEQKKIFEKSIEEYNTKITNEAAELSKYQQELKHLEMEISSVEKELEKVKKLKCQLDTKKEEITKIEKVLEVFESKLKELATSYRLIESNKGKCPVCLREIKGDEEKEHIKKEIATQGKEYKEKKEVLSAKLSNLKKEYQQLEEKVKQEDALRSKEKKLHGLFENLKAKIDQKNKNIENLRNSISESQQRINLCDDEISKLEKKLQDLKNELNRLNFDGVNYSRVSKRVKELEVYSRLLKEIEISKVKAENLKNNLLEYQNEAQQLVKKIQEIDEQLLQMVSDSPEENLKEIQSNINTYESKIKNLQEDLTSVLKEIGIFEQKLEQAKQAKEKVIALEKEMEDIKREIEVYDIIIDITGPDGIKNEIIANTLPLIRDEANRLLKLLTNGAFSIDFKTQKETASGKTIETLQIEISDINGTRNYELFSGGELFRINFAIRIALAKVLLKRAGASIRMLILDEGFGSQDEEGKDHIIECLNQIKDQFDTILVITHIEDLMDAFDQRIVVKKDMEGSKIFVV
ncbi:AAA family ATPase [Caldicellulosiruptor naganoensis]|uniref:Nuclease SbcCD subunit C n=1 Tax=Caldicellulosiruptor naganoensis TaxID=29324 RepID=A0ABY7BDK1_9FIRM|nr:SMC family ATPase [Caldicellulosiruptor naganoensis]WAM30897.1 SMC family ATPase [Caldicellulosiruptor naganoensis]